MLPPTWEEKLRETKGSQLAGVGGVGGRQSIAAHQQQSPEDAPGAPRCHGGTWGRRSGAERLGGELPRGSQPLGFGPARLGMGNRGGLVGVGRCLGHLRWAVPKSWDEVGPRERSPRGVRPHSGFIYESLCQQRARTSAHATSAWHVLNYSRAPTPPERAPRPQTPNPGVPGQDARSRASSLHPGPRQPGWAAAPGGSGGSPRPAPGFCRGSPGGSPGSAPGAAPPPAPPQPALPQLQLSPKPAQTLAALKRCGKQHEGGEGGGSEPSPPPQKRWAPPSTSRRPRARLSAEPSGSPRV